MFFSSIADIRKFVIEKQPEGLLVDTNILILFLIGSYDPTFIEKCEVLNNSDKRYSIDDFELLKKIFTFFKKLVITPQIIAELSNVSITRGGIYGEKLISYLQTVIKFLKSAEERHQKSDCLWGMDLEILGKYGFTDITMFKLSHKTNMPILTDDNPFCYRFRGEIPIIRLEDIKNQQYQSALK